MPRTRSKGAAKVSKTETTPTEIKANTLPPSEENPPKLFTLPKDTSSEARIVTLKNPATSIPNRYLFCPEKGFYEFTKIAAPKKTPRSWLLTSKHSERDGSKEETTSEKEVSSTDPDAASGEQDQPVDDTTSSNPSYITNSADLFLATPIDLLFMILPALTPSSTKETKQLFLSLDDHLDTLSTGNPHLRQVLRDARLRNKITNRMEAFCDTVDAGDEKMFRLSHEKLLKVLLAKAERMSKNGLPASMEEKFIRSTLEAPIMSIKREESNISIATETESVIPEDAGDSQQTQSSETPGTATPSTTADSQSTEQSVATSMTSISTVTETAIKPLTSTPPGVTDLLRLRTSLTFILQSYLPSSLHLPLQTLLSTLPSPDFTPLDAHLTHLASLRAEAQALRSISDNISRKRGYENDDEAAEARAEKKRRKEEEEKRKKTESRGVKQLKKVDTSGMMKLSAFFGKGPAKKKT